jgi:hypothetical protein
MKISFLMQRFARWHIWLGWLAAVPLLLWTVSGLVMVARPIEEVRGTNLRAEHQPQPIPAGFAPVLPFLEPGQPPVASYRIELRHAQPVARVIYADDSTALFDARSGARLTPLNQAAALSVVSNGMKHGGAASAVLFAADHVPFDFRRKIPVWQVTLTDGTHVYVGRDTGEIEAVRTRYWRLFDFMWGLHIMDPAQREDTSHPLLIGAAVIALLSVLLGVTLLFRRRRARP